MILPIFKKLMMKKQLPIIKILCNKNHLFDSTKGLSMRAAGEDKFGRDKEFKFGLMVQGIKESL